MLSTTAWRYFQRMLWERDRGICGLCKLPVPIDSAMAIDHVLPVSKGGNDDLANLQVSHKRCNDKKGDGTPRLVKTVRAPRAPRPARAIQPIEGLTVREVAEWWQVTPKTIRRWIASGLLTPAGKASDRAGWRIGQSDFEQLMRRKSGTREGCG